MDNEIGLEFFRDYMFNAIKEESESKTHDDQGVIQRGKRLQIVREKENVSRHALL